MYTCSSCAQLGYSTNRVDPPLKHQKSNIIKNMHTKPKPQVNYTKTFNNCKMLTKNHLHKLYSKHSLWENKFDTYSFTTILTGILTTTDVVAWLSWEVSLFSFLLWWAEKSLVSWVKNHPNEAVFFYLGN